MPVFCVPQVFENVEMEGAFDGYATVIAGDSFCVKEEILELFTDAQFDYSQKMWFVKPDEWGSHALAKFNEIGVKVDVVAPDDEGG